MKYYGRVFYINYFYDIDFLSFILKILIATDNK
jgi:hypothetical protein